jgi:hypothetical protein
LYSICLAARYSEIDIKACMLCVTLSAKEHDFAVDMSRGAARGLNEESAAQKSFLVRIENADERNFRKIETFPEQIDPTRISNSAARSPRRISTRSMVSMSLWR